VNLVALVVVVLAIAALWMAADRARTIAVCRFSLGRVQVVRGRLAPAPLAEVVEIGRAMRIHSGAVIVRREGGAVAVRVRGLDDQAAQRLRNALGRFHERQLRG
jgi:hypothetical protein